MTADDRPLVVDVAQLRRQLATQERIDRRAVLDGLRATGAQVPGGEVHVAVTLESISDGVVVTGQVAAPWTAECRRCLDPMVGEVEVSLRELYEDDADEEAEILPIVDEHVDLEPPVRDAVMLALPLAPLCSEACQGLCPTCGTNRNEGACDCVVDTGDPRWAALSELTFPDDDRPDPEAGPAA